MDGSPDQVGSLQPWQVYSALYLGFYLTTIYFDHFLISFVFCIAFGVICEILTRYMNGQDISQFTGPKKVESMDSLVCMARSEAKLVPSLTQMAKVEASNPSPRHSVRSADKDDDLIEDDFERASPPPPLPAKDYLSSTESTIDEVNKRLSQVMERSFNQEDETEEEATKDDFYNEQKTDLLGEIKDDFLKQGSQAAQDHHKTTFDSDVALQRRDEEENNDDVLRHVAEGHCPVVQDIQTKSATPEMGNKEQQRQENVTENIRSMSEIKKQLSSDTEEEEEEDEEDEEDVFVKPVETKEAPSNNLANPSKTITESMIDREINLLSTRLEDEVGDIGGGAGGGEMYIENDVTETEAKYIENNITKEKNTLDDFLADSNAQLQTEAAPFANNNFTADSLTGGAAVAAVRDNLMDSSFYGSLDSPGAQFAGHDSLMDSSLDASFIAAKPNATPTSFPIDSNSLVDDSLLAEDLSSSDPRNYSVAASTEKVNQEKISKQAEDDLKATAISEENIDDAFAKKSADEVEETKVRGAEGLKQVLEGGEKKLYAPDSSSDEELEEEYANRAVDLDASESEEEEYRPRGGAAANTELQTKPEQATQNGGSSNVEVLGTMKDDELPKHSKQSVNDEIADIDLTDPELENAANKIAAAFKGFKARQKSQK